MQAEPRGAETEDEHHDAVWSVRPRLRHDVLFADTGSGVLLRHAEASFVVKGRSAYRFLSALAPFLDGGATVEELAAAVPAGQHPMLLGLVRTLIARGFARDRSPAADDALDEHIRDRFRQQIDYVEHYVDGAVERFARFRDLRVLVAGEGEVAEWAALALLRNGSAAVHTAGPARTPDSVSEEARLLEEQGCTARVHATDLVPADMRVKDLGGYDVVLLADPHDFPRVWNLCADEDAPPLLPAVVLGDHAMLGPFHAPQTGSCWSCALLRYTEAAPADEAARVWRGLAVDESRVRETALPTPQAAMLGNALAFEVFRWSTGVLDTETLGAALFQDIRTLDTSSELVLPHPRCPSCREGTGARGTHVPLLADVVPGPSDEVSVEVDHGLAELMVGPRTGLITQHLDLELPQSPLKVGRAALSGHGRRGHGIARADIHTTLRARLRTMRAAALRHVGENAVLVPVPGADAPVPLEASRISTATGVSGTRGMEERAYGIGLVDRTVYEVPAAAVHPFSGLNAAGTFERTCAGEGAGSEPGHAVHEALLSAGAFDGLRAVLAGRPAERVVPGARPEGSELGFLMSVAETMDLATELLRLPGPVPAVLARDTGSTDWQIGYGTRPMEAAAAALRDLIARIQYVEAGAGDAETGPSWSSTLDPRALPVEERAPEGWLTDTPVVGAEQICAELAREGRTAIAVPTGTSDLVGCGVHTAKVLLTTVDGTARGEAAK